MKMSSSTAVPAPTEQSLHEAAVRHLARYATTAASLTAVLDRRVTRWTRSENPDAYAQAAAIRAVRTVVERLVASGAVNDSAFAEARTRRLVGSGRSAKAVAAHLSARGVAAATVRDVLPDDAERDLVGAIITARRRRIGPFRASGAVHESADPNRELGVLARAGFDRATAQSALAMDRSEAEERIARYRRDDLPVR